MSDIRHWTINIIRHIGYYYDHDAEMIILAHSIWVQYKALMWSDRISSHHRPWPDLVMIAIPEYEYLITSQTTAWPCNDSHTWVWIYYIIVIWVLYKAWVMFDDYESPLNHIFYQGQTFIWNTNILGKWLFNIPRLWRTGQMIRLQSGTR